MKSTILNLLFWSGLVVLAFVIFRAADRYGKRVGAEMRAGEKREEDKRIAECKASGGEPVMGYLRRAALSRAEWTIVQCKPGK